MSDSLSPEVAVSALASVPSVVVLAALIAIIRPSRPFRTRLRAFVVFVVLTIGVTLVAEPPSPGAAAAPTADPSRYAAMVARSDDVADHGDAFAEAARELIQAGLCSEADLLENGGWVKSMDQRSAPVYFT